MILELLVPALLTATFVGVSAGYLGSLMVLEKMALVGDALSHVALPGLAIGILLGLETDYSFVIAFVFLFLSAVLVWYVQRVTKLSFETIVGAAFTLALAIGILLIPEPELLEALFGDITTVTLENTLAAIIISLITVFVARKIYKRLILGMISEDLAISKGISAAKINLLYLCLVSVVVAIGIRIVGTLLVGFLVIVPAAAAKNLSSNLSRYSLLSIVFGVISAFSGVLIAGYTDLPAGPLVVLSGIVIFIATIVARAKMK